MVSTTACGLDFGRLFRKTRSGKPRFRSSIPPGIGYIAHMELEVESHIICPYCGANYTTVVDTSAGTFSTIEDCEVCCRPIAVNVHCHYGEIDSVEIDRA